MLFTVFVNVKILADAVNVVLAVAVAVIILALFLLFLYVVLLFRWEPNTIFF